MSAIPYSTKPASFFASESNEGRTIARLCDFVTRRCRSSNTIGHASLHADLDSLEFEFSRPNWDGYGARPVSAAAVRNAHRLLDTIPPVKAGIALSVGAEPDGEVTVEWHKSSSWTLSVSVSPSGDLHYSAMLGPGTVFGTEPFDPSLGLPSPLPSLIRRIEAA